MKADHDQHFSIDAIRDMGLRRTEAARDGIAAEEAYQLQIDKHAAEWVTAKGLGRVEAELLATVTVDEEQPELYKAVVTHKAECNRLDTLIAVGVHTATIEYGSWGLHSAFSPAAKERATAEKA